MEDKIKESTARRAAQAVRTKKKLTEAKSLVKSDVFTQESEEDLSACVEFAGPANNPDIETHRQIGRLLGLVKNQLLSDEERLKKAQERKAAYKLKKSEKKHKKT